MEFRTLKADEIDVRVGIVKEDYGFYTLLLYKDARCDMNILDETLTAESWQRDHKEIKGNLYCGVGIWSERLQQFIWKWDCGTESNTEKEKGEASDSFKRACVNWGIGRELYTCPLILIESKYAKEESKQRKFRVKEIEYNEKREITKLVIVDTKGVQVYPKSVVITKENAVISGNEIHCVDCDESVSKKVADYSISKYGKVLCFDCQKHYIKEEEV